MKRVPFFENPMLRVQFPMWRGRLVLILIGLAFIALALRALYLQGLTTEFLQQQGERRFERTLTLPDTCLKPDQIGPTKLPTSPRLTHKFMLLLANSLTRTSSSPSRR